jgi:hypothetical protein
MDQVALITRSPGLNFNLASVLFCFFDAIGCWVRAIRIRDISRSSS